MRRFLGALVSPPISQALAGDAFQGFGAAFCVGDLAIAVAKIEFMQVALRVLLAAVLIDAAHAALEDREKSLDRIGVGCATAIFAL